MDSHYESLNNSNASKHDILSNFGSPTLISFVDDNLWIYYSEEIEYFLFLKGKAIDRKIITMEFDEAEKLKKLNKITLKDTDKNFAFNQEKTVLDYQNKSLFRRISESIGQVRAN